MYEYYEIFNILIEEIQFPLQFIVSDSIIVIVCPQPTPLGCTVCIHNWVCRGVHESLYIQIDHNAILERYIARLPPCHPHPSPPHRREFQENGYIFELCLFEIYVDFLEFISLNIRNARKCQQSFMFLHKLNQCIM